MKTKQGLFSLLSRLGKDKRASSPGLLTRLLRDEEGSYLIYFTIALPIFIGLASLGTEGGLLFYHHRTLQSATDAAAYTAANCLLARLQCRECSVTGGGDLCQLWLRRNFGTPGMIRPM